MSPSELEAYKKQMIDKVSKQAKQMAAASNVKLDEMSLPDFELKPPVKDIKRLAMLPVQPPTLIQLTDGIRKAKQQLETVTPQAIKDEVKSITSTQTPAQQQSSSVAEFYADKPVQALLVSMNSAIQNPNEVIGWNNLAAICNMAGLEHKAILILMNQLVKFPGNSMLLNNMGQAFLGLGELNKAEDFLRQCLVEDPMHPEANRSMGMICFFRDQYEAGMKYFEKELEQAHRRSTLALLKRKNLVTNIYKLRKKRTSIPGKNFFNEIQLGKFVVPSFPESSAETNLKSDEHSGFRNSVTQEILFWLDKGNATKEELLAEGRGGNGLYAEQVKRLLEDLHEVYKPYELALFDEVQLNHLKSLIDTYGEQMAQVKCPLAPIGASYEAMMAYQKKCCDLKRAVLDPFIAQYNAFVTMRINAVRPVWKEYVNDLINIVSLDPSAANKRYVSHVIYQYFLFLATASEAGQFIDMPMECNSKMTSAQADSVIQSSRDIDLSCPAWLNLELDVQVAKIKADCSKYAIEASGSIFRGGFERDFKTGTSTLSAGVGIKAKFFAEVGGAEMKQMVYVSWDNNNRFCDLGLKGTAAVKIGDNPFKIVDGFAKVGATVAGVEGGYTLGINSGFNSSVKGKGIIADFIKIDQSL